MSWEAFHWAAAVTYPPEQPSTTAKCLLLMLAWHCSRDGFDCYPSIGRLAGATSMDRSTVKRWLQQFEEDGLIERELRFDSTGRQTSTRYRLVAAETWTRSVPDPNLALSRTQNSRQRGGAHSAPLPEGGGARDAPGGGAHSAPGEGCTGAPPMKDSLNSNKEEEDSVLFEDSSEPRSGSDLARSMIALWNDSVGEAGGGAVRQLTEAREKALRNRWRDTFGSSMEQWRAFCLRIAASAFLTGKILPSGGRATPFRIDLDWALKPANAVKIIEGKYDGGGAGRPRVAV